VKTQRRNEIRSEGLCAGRAYEISLGMSGRSVGTCTVVILVPLTASLTGYPNSGNASR
jgi:hypothetical protein